MRLRRNELTIDRLEKELEINVGNKLEVVETENNYKLIVFVDNNNTIIHSWDKPEYKKLRFLVFVYGTLLKGESNYSRLEDSPKIGDATLNNKFEMRTYSFDYPTLFKSTKNTLPIIGEVYMISQRVLDDLDRLEGVENNLFVRTVESVNIWIGDTLCHLPCLVYSAGPFFGKSIKNRMTVIKHGNWRKYLEDETL